MKFIILDILHTGNHGVKGMRKLGGRYDDRRGTEVEIELSDYEPGDCLIFERNNLPILLTTPFVEARDIGDNIEIETVNSIYIMKKVE